MKLSCIFHTLGLGLAFTLCALWLAGFFNFRFLMFLVENFHITACCALAALVFANVPCDSEVQP